MIDPCAAREAYEREEIGDIGWVKTTDNLANTFTRMTISKTLE